MRSLRVTATPDPNDAPLFFQLLAASPAVAEARLLDWNLATEREATVLFAIDGDPHVFDGLADAPVILDVEATPTDGGCYLIVRADPTRLPMFAEMFTLLTQPGLVVVKPVVYRDGHVHARLVGTSDALAILVENHPDSITLDVHEITQSFTGPDTAAAALSDRQREAVVTAIELGYYDTPRQATHEDVADHLDCAPSTASEHLQKAEAQLVHASMAESGYSK